MEGRGEATHERDGVNVIINAVRGEAHETGIKPEAEEEKNECGQEPHDAERHRRSSAPGHVERSVIDLRLCE